MMAGSVCFSQTPAAISPCFKPLLERHYDFTELKLYTLTQIDSTTYDLAKQNTSLSNSYPFLSTSTSYSDFREKRDQFFREQKFDNLDIEGLKAMAGLFYMIKLRDERCSTVTQPTWQSPKDLLFSWFAHDFREPAFCEKIDPKAEYSLGFNPKGFRGQYAQSACYMDLAELTQQSGLCAKVVPVTSPLRNGSGYSRENCESGVLSKRKYGAQVPASDSLMLPQPFEDNMVGVFEEAGYAYATLTKRKEFEDRIQARGLANGSVEIIKPAEVYSLFYNYVVYRAPEKEREEFKHRLLNLK